MNNGNGRSRIGAAVTAVVLTLLLSTACSTPPSISPVTRNQRFTGLVNGSASGAVVRTICAGSGAAEGRGYARPGQTVAAVLDATGRGNTGDNGAVFVLPNTNAEFVQLRNWNEAVAFPTDIQVPCDGPGVIVFDPCFGFVGCRGSAVADAVTVHFSSD